MSDNPPLVDTWASGHAKLPVQMVARMLNCKLGMMMPPCLGKGVGNDSDSDNDNDEDSTSADTQRYCKQRLRVLQATMEACFAIGNRCRPATQ